MIVPQKNYSVEVKFDRLANRWMAVFNSEKPEGISYSFPLSDSPQSLNVAGTLMRPLLTHFEEAVLALVFQQMVTTVLKNLEKQQQHAIEGQQSQTEATLVN